MARYIVSDEHFPRNGGGISVPSLSAKAYADAIYDIAASEARNTELGKSAYGKSVEYTMSAAAADGGRCCPSEKTHIPAMAL